MTLSLLPAAGDRGPGQVLAGKVLRGGDTPSCCRHAVTLSRCVTVTRPQLNKCTRGVTRHAGHHHPTQPTCMSPSVDLLKGRVVRCCGPSHDPLVSSEGVCLSAAAPLQILDNNCRHASLVPAAWSWLPPLQLCSALVWSECGIVDVDIVA